MFAIMGISGRVGSAVAQNILESGLQVRAIVRNKIKGDRWKALGCDVSVADIDNSSALATAFAGTQGAFVMLPPAFDQKPGLEEGHRRADNIRKAILEARPSKVVALSTYGAHVERPNLFNELGYLEKVLADLDIPVTILRAAWYMENHEWDLPSARTNGVIHSHLQPLDQALPMVSTRDVGGIGAKLLIQEWNGHRVIEVEGPETVSPNRLAKAFTTALDKEVHAQAVPRNSWDEGFRSNGIKHPEAWIQSLDGTNEGWLAFEKDAESRLKGQISIDEVIASIVLAHH